MPEKFDRYSSAVIMGRIHGGRKDIVKGFSDEKLGKKLRNIPGRVPGAILGRIPEEVPEIVSGRFNEKFLSGNFWRT